MKYLFKFKLLFFLTFCFNCLCAEEINEAYLIEVGKIDIGKLYWNISLSNNNYNISIKLEDGGFLSGIYNFKGNYKSYGIIKNKKPIPLNYKQSWTTNKKRKDVEMLFTEGKLTKLVLYPEEKEHARINYLDSFGYLDPLSSFLNILMGAKKSKTIDGRRIYSMVSNIEGDKEKILIKDYTNIWADHKRNDLEYITIIGDLKKNVLELPVNIEIKFKKLLFKLKKI